MRPSMPCRRVGRARLGARSAHRYGRVVGVSPLSVPRATFDLQDPAFVADPYTALAEGRALAPVLWHEQLGEWGTTTHAAANDVLRDRRLGRILSPRSDGDDGWTTFD